MFAGRRRHIYKKSVSMGKFSNPHRPPPPPAPSPVKTNNGLTQKYCVKWHRNILILRVIPSSWGRVGEDPGNKFMTRIKWTEYYIHLIRWFSMWYVRIYFAGCVGGEEKYEQWAKCALVLYAKPSIRGLLFHYEKNFILQMASIVLVRVFRNILIPSVRMMLTMSTMLARTICQTIEWEVNYFTAKEKCFFNFYFLVKVSKTSSFCQP